MNVWFAFKLFSLPAILLQATGRYLRFHRKLTLQTFNLEASTTFNLQLVTKIFAKGPKVHKLQSSFSPSINVELQVQFKQILHGYNIDCGGKGKALQLPFYFFFFSFSSAFFDGQTEVLFIFFPDCYFKRMWPGSELLVWYSVCFQAMSFRRKQ